MLLVSDDSFETSLSTLPLAVYLVKSIFWFFSYFHLFAYTLPGVAHGGASELCITLRKDVKFLLTHATSTSCF